MVDGLGFQGIPIRLVGSFQTNPTRRFSNRLPRYITRSLPRVVARCRDIESLHLRGGWWQLAGRLALCGIHGICCFLSYKDSLFNGKSKTCGRSKTFGNTEVVVEVQWAPINTNEHQFNLTSKWQKHETSTACLADDLRCWQDGCSLGKIDVLQAALRIR